MCIRDRSCTINLAFYFAREYYTIVRELPSGKGFADICFIPRKKHMDKPAVIIELKWDKTAEGAIEQIKQNRYMDSLKEYHGELLLAGINYDKKTKEHTLSLIHIFGPERLCTVENIWRTQLFCYKTRKRIKFRIAI